MADAIENPWADLTEYKGKIFAKCDKEDLERFSEMKLRSRIVDLEGSGERLNDKKKLHLELLPEPCIGNPATATLVILGTNPGFSKEDEVAFKYYKDTIRKNLENEHSRTMYWVDTASKITSPEGNDYVNEPRKWYFGDPKDGKHEAGSVGTLQRLLFALSYKGSFDELHNELQKERGLDPQTEDYWDEVVKEVLKNRSRDQAHEIMRNHVAVIDIFPYHSKNAKGLKSWMFNPSRPEIKERAGLTSRLYTKQMVEDALENNARILVGRRHNDWTRLVPKLLDHVESKRVFGTSSRSRTYLNPNNVVTFETVFDSKTKRTLKTEKKDSTLFWDTVDSLLEAWRSTTTNDL